MNKEIKAYLRVDFKVFILEVTKKLGKVSKILREYNVNKTSYYNWKKKYEKEGRQGLYRKKPSVNNHPKRLSEDAIAKILELRASYQMGPERIMWYLSRYHGIETSESTVYRTLVRHDVNRLSKKASRRTVHTKRYSKKVPGHHIQIDVKFVNFNDENNQAIRRYQYTAIDDSTRVRALKIYPRHTQKNAIDFVNYVVAKFPFRIHTIRTDRGHEFQALFHWHVEDLGMKHAYIKPRSSQLNGKVERSHRTDREEFYQLLTYIDDVDLNEKLKNWEDFYNFNRPHSALNGHTPYEVLREKLSMEHSPDSLRKIRHQKKKNGSD